MVTYTQLTRQLRTLSFLPVVRTSDATTALAICEPLVAAGIYALEITATIDGWQETIRSLRTAYPEVTVGAGTIITADQAAEAIAAGSQFLISPGSFPAVAEVAAAAEVPYMPAAFTPTELFTAPHHGLVKLFPASLGGVSHLKALTALKPDAEILPTGGIRPADISAWKAAGAITVGMGVKSVEDARTLLAQIQEQENA